MQRIRLNGEIKEVDSGINVADLIAGLELEPDRIVAQQNGNIITREKFSEHLINAGDEIELLKFMAGG